MNNTHTHPRTDELHVYTVPADTDHKMEMKVVRNHFRAMMDLVGGYIEVVRTGLPELPCGCRLVMVVNEEGRLQDLPRNSRAETYYPGTIAGDVFLVGEGLVPDNEGFAEPDFFSLPQNFSTWEGPGSPLPTDKQPWED